MRMDDKIKVTFPGGKRVNAEYKGFLIETDQPVYSGGEGKAPAPIDLFIASIATCAGWYVLSFCQSRKIPTEGSSVEISTERNPQTKRIEKITIDIQLPPEFPEKYQNAVIKAVDLCAVKVHILNPPSFKINAEINS
jgi:ribosomal protein S12 methylthiotransferase accessory factor